MTWQPLILAICPATEPVAPAAPETTTVSPATGRPTSSRPKSQSWGAVELVLVDGALNGGGYCGVLGVGKIDRRHGRSLSRSLVVTRPSIPVTPTAAMAIPTAAILFIMAAPAITAGTGRRDGPLMAAASIGAPAATMAAIVAATGCTSPSGGSQYVPAPLGGPGLGNREKGCDAPRRHHPGRRPRAHDRDGV